MGTQLREPKKISRRENYLLPAAYFFGVWCLVFRALRQSRVWCLVFSVSVASPLAIE